MAPKNGRAVDAQGNPSVDPTANVLQLVAAERRRTDDLRTADTRRTDDLRSTEASHLRETMMLRAEYDEKLRDAEAKRIDAIRAVDVNAVSVAAARAADQATVLATQLTTSADTLRALVASSAATLASQLTSIITPITERLAALEKANWENQGRGPLATAQTESVSTGLAALAKEVAGLRESRSEGSGKTQGEVETKKGFTNSWAILSGAVLLALALYAAVNK